MKLVGIKILKYLGFRAAPVLTFYNHTQNTSGKLYFLCKTAHYGKNSISFFQQFFANVDKIFILRGRLGTRL